MPLPKPTACTSDDYWNLPEGRRAELIDGELFDMAPPGRTHQKIAVGLVQRLQSFVERNGGPCEVYMAPFAVNLTADDTTWVEPDVLVVCDPAKLSERGCEGAPDLIVEIVSPSSVTMDYFTKTARYQRAGVREYWIVDPSCRQVTVYRYETPQYILRTYAFEQSVPVGIFGLETLAVTIGEFA